MVYRDLLILFSVAFIPFTTLLMGEYGNITAAIWLYALNLIAIGLSGAWLWYHATKGHRLVDPDLDPQLIRQILLRALSTPAAGVIVILLTFVVGAYATFGFLLIAVFQIIVTRRFPAANQET